MNIDDIIERVSEIYGLKSQAALARWFEISPSTLHDRIRNAREDLNRTDDSTKKERNFGNKIYEDILVRIAQDDRINPNYIFFGKPPKFFDEKTVRRIRGDERTSHEDDETFTIPYFSDIRASAGNGYCNDHDCEPEYLVMPKALCKSKPKNESGRSHTVKIGQYTL